MARSAQHTWETFTNPRNGRVRIQACIKCGVARGLELGVKTCEASSVSAHKMRAAGWQPKVAA